MGMHIMFARGAWQAANRLNNEAVLAIMEASPKWHSQEIPGSIVTCLTKDLDSLDTDLGRSLLNVIRLVLQTISRIVVTASIITDFIWPALTCCVLAAVVGRAYSKTTRPVKNLVKAARSPVFTLYSETRGSGYLAGREGSWTDCHESRVWEDVGAQAPCLLASPSYTAQSRPMASHSR